MEYPKMEVHSGDGVEIHMLNDHDGFLVVADVLFKRTGERCLPLTRKEAEAVAALFAAAPELLTAAKSALEALRIARPIESKSKEGPVITAAFKQLDAAIKAAECF